MTANSITTRVFFIEKDKVFMMLRNGKNGNTLGGSKKRWITPGGSTDEGEDGITAAIRETEEEVGITLEPKDLTLILEKHDPKFNVMMEFFVCLKWDGELKVLEPEKFDLVVWQPIDKVKELETHDATIGIYILDALTVLRQQQRNKRIPKFESLPPITWAKW